jgi:nitronate monooxygenase
MKRDAPRVLANNVTRSDGAIPFVRARMLIGDEEGRPIYLFSKGSPASFRDQSF